MLKIGVHFIGFERGFANHWPDVLIDIHKNNWILNEINLKVEEVPENLFPEHALPEFKTKKPVAHDYSTMEDINKYSGNYNYPGSTR